jgi:uncharacterized protein YkwD
MVVDRIGGVHSPVVDPFAAIMLGVVGMLVTALLLIGLYHPRTGAQALKWQPTRSPELEVQNEIDDLDEMLEAINERRARRGLPGLNEDTLRVSIGAERAKLSKRRDEYLAELDVEQMLTVKNERRAAKGLPPITAEEYRAQVARERW